ncbi:mad2l1-binding protein [Anaeramoeba ignava]|uniref:Mad2l1-binding protein n=1 Tax=Anaeramoeba ignava TaxID=1746090 RepID=A0A9Q0RDN0_ANAIG|nr:mad2l1-binding protein [Anaeramoeba ignava]
MNQEFFSFSISNFDFSPKSSSIIFNSLIKHIFFMKGQIPTTFEQLQNNLNQNEKQKNFQSKNIKSKLTKKSSKFLENIQIWFQTIDSILFNNIGFKDENEKKLINQLDNQMQIENELDQNISRIKLKKIVLSFGNIITNPKEVYVIKTSKLTDHLNTENFGNEVLFVRETIQQFIINEPQIFRNKLVCTRCFMFLLIGFYSKKEEFFKLENFNFGIFQKNLFPKKKQFITQVLQKGHHLLIDINLEKDENMQEELQKKSFFSKKIWFSFNNFVQGFNI